MTPLRGTDPYRSLLTSIVRTETAVRIGWIAEKLKMGTAANLTRVSKVIAGRLAGNRKLKRIKKQIYAVISDPYFLRSERS